MTGNLGDKPDMKSLDGALLDVEVDRPYAEQLEDLGLLQYRFPGKKVLEVGSGKREELARHMSDQGADVTVLNPKYAGAVTADGALMSATGIPHVDKIRRFAERIETYDTEEQYDLIVGSHSVPLHLPADALSVFFERIARMLKPDGVARFYPVFPSLNGDGALMGPFLGKHPSYSASMRLTNLQQGHSLQCLVIEKR